MTGTELPSGVVTFLFTDVEESTRRWEADAEAMQAALAAHDEFDMRGFMIRGIHTFIPATACATVLGAVIGAVPAASADPADELGTAWDADRGRYCPKQHRDEDIACEC